MGQPSLSRAVQHTSNYVIILRRYYGKGPTLTKAEHGQILAFHRAKWSKVKIANEHGIAPLSVTYSLDNHWEKKPSNRKGRVPAISDTQQSVLLRPKSRTGESVAKASRELNLSIGKRRPQQLCARSKHLRHKRMKPTPVLKQRYKEARVAR